MTRRTVRRPARYTPDDLRTAAADVTAQYPERARYVALVEAAVRRGAELAVAVPVLRDMQRDDWQPPEAEA